MNVGLVTGPALSILQNMVLVGGVSWHLDGAGDCLEPGDELGDHWVGSWTGFWQRRSSCSNLEPARARPPELEQLGSALIILGKEP